MQLWTDAIFLSLFPWHTSLSSRYPEHDFPRGSIDIENLLPLLKRELNHFERVGDFERELKESPPLNLTDIVVISGVLGASTVCVAMMSLNRCEFRARLSLLQSGDSRMANHYGKRDSEKQAREGGLTFLVTKVHIGCQHTKY